MSSEESHTGGERASDCRPLTNENRRLFRMLHAIQSTLGVGSFSPVYQKCRKGRQGRYMEGKYTIFPFRTR